MADISLIDYKFTYRELIEAKDLWESFLKSQMSSIYNDDYSLEFNLIIAIQFASHNI